MYSSPVADASICIGCWCATPSSFSSSLAGAVVVRARWITSGCDLRSSVIGSGNGLRFSGFYIDSARRGRNVSKKTSFLGALRLPGRFPPRFAGQSGKDFCFFSLPRLCSLGYTAPAFSRFSSLHCHRLLREVFTPQRQGKFMPLEIGEPGPDNCEF